MPSRSDETDESPSGDDRGLNYHSFPDTADETTPSTEAYRGFSTSINDMFIHPDNERVDCCALACCGVLQSDRDRYLTTGIKPPTCCRRFWIHFCLPLLMFGMAMFCAVKVPDPWLNQILSTGFVFTFLAYFVIQCIKGTWKRRDVRKEMLWSKYHLMTTGDFRQRTDEDSVEEGPGRAPYLMGQTRGDLRNAHALCGCYATDRSANHQYKETDQISLCTRFFQCFERSCCGTMCGMHLQLCGLCAMAQEARQLEVLLHAGYRRIDYVTMQPMIEYYPAIYEARYSDEHSSSWWDRLSSFSKWVLYISGGFTLLLLGWSVLPMGEHHKFGPKNFLVFCATLAQATILLKIVYWRHPKDVSVDALIKCFASGFCLSSTLAIFFELVIGLAMKLVMSILMAFSGIDIVESNGFTLASPGFGTMGNAMQETGGGSSSYRDYLHAYGKDHPFIYTIYLFITAFILAAMIEELCKYFGYRMVDHPDFLSRRELEEAAECFNDDNTEEQEEQETPDFSQQDRSLQSRGAAITVSMVAASLGFACCENLVYIFVYGEASFAVEVFILLARSLFPVHPIAAALQSIRVCQRDLEKEKKMRLGHIIFPGVLFHGLYDFCLMWIDFMASRKANYVEDDEVDDEVVNSESSSDLISLVVSLFIIFIAYWYYIRASRQQRERLKAMDQETSVDRSRLI
jgi:RsiW-degrading membrane proteinase PrsW (M82 family)